MKSLADVANLADVTRRLSGAFASYWEGEGVKSLAKVANLADVTRRLSGAFATRSRLCRRTSSDHRFR